MSQVDFHSDEVLFYLNSPINCCSYWIILCFPLQVILALGEIFNQGRIGDQSFVLLYAP